MIDTIKYIISPELDSINAIYRGKKIGEITFVRVGNDRLIIDYTNVIPEFRHKHIGLGLVRNAANMARNQHRYVITLCPFAQAMFNKFPEFDDIRLINAH